MSLFLASCTKDKLPRPNLDLKFELDLGESITLDNQLTIEFRGYSLEPFCEPETSIPCAAHKRPIDLTITTPDSIYHHVLLIEDTIYSQTEEIEGIVIKLLKLHAPLELTDINSNSRIYIELETTEI